MRTHHAIARVPALLLAAVTPAHAHAATQPDAPTPTQTSVRPADVTAPVPRLDAEPLAWAEGRTIEQVVSRLLDRRERFAPSLGFAAGGPLLFGAFLSQNESATVRYPFEAGRVYAVLGAADPAAADIDLDVSGDEDGESHSDAMIDAFPIVAFIPKSTKVHDITVTMWDTEKPAFTAILVLELDGADVEPGRIERAVRACLGQEPAGARTRLMRTDQTFTFAAALLAPDESITLRNAAPGGGRARLLGGAEADARALLLRIEEDDRGRPIAGDTFAIAGGTLRGAISFDTDAPVRVTMGNAGKTHPDGTDEPAATGVVVSALVVD